MAVALIQKTRDFTTEVVDELKKVTWPDLPQLKNATFVIIIFIFIVSAIIWVMDQVVNLVVGPNGLILKWFAR
jgi:preprotein translocase SecE subunit